MITLQEFDKFLHKKLASVLPHEELREVILYSALPAGKMIRAQIIFSLGEDLKIPKDHLMNFAAFMELHHTYTLIHDDLPAMDNDDFRRGRPSSHKKYNEWKAILAGDSLMSISFHFLNEIKNHQLMKLALWCTGPKGLILGQYLDLKQKPTSFSELIRIHELKTARLFILCFLGTFYLSNHQKNYNNIKNFIKLGNSWGLIFQLQDDLEDKEHTQFKELIQNKIKKLESQIQLTYLAETQKLFLQYRQLIIKS